MNDNNFSSLSELYTYLYPALNTKVNDLKTKGYIIKEVELWNYLINNVWKDKKNLTTYDMVSDIMMFKNKQRSV